MTDILQQFVRRAAELRRSRSTSNEHINQLNDVAFNLRHTDPRLSHQLSENALRLSTANDYERGRAAALRNVGVHQINTNQYQLAVDTFEQCRRIFHRLQDQVGLAASVDGRGVAQMHLGRNQQAFESLLNSCQIFERLDDKSYVAHAHGIIGIIYRQQGDYSLALEHYYRGLHFATVAHLPQQQANLYNSLGYLFWRLDETDEAIEYLQQALPICQAQQNRGSESSVTLNLGAAYLIREQHADALQHLEHGLALARDASNLQLQADAHLQIGTLQRATGDLSEAASSMWQALQISRNIGNRSNEAEALVELGLLSKQAGELSEARELLEHAAAMSTEIGYKETLYKAHLGLSEVCEAAGDAAAALRHHQAFFRVSSDVSGPGAAVRLGRVLQQHKLSRETPPSELLSEHAGQTNGFTEIITASGERAGGLEVGKLRQVVEYVRHNLAGNLTVAELASVVALEEKHFQRQFKRSTGQTPHQFVVKQRVAHAQLLLQRNELPLSEVAQRSGFCSQSHLTMQFRLVHGTTPKKYRKNKRLRYKLTD